MRFSPRRPQEGQSSGRTMTSCARLTSAASLSSFVSRASRSPSASLDGLGSPVDVSASAPPPSPPSASASGTCRPSARFSSRDRLYFCRKTLLSFLPGCRPSTAEFPDGSLISTIKGVRPVFRFASFATKTVIFSALSGSLSRSSAIFKLRLSMTSVMMPSTVVRRPRRELGMSSSTWGMLTDAASERSTLLWRSASTSTLTVIWTPDSAI
mmetsp:Transcript_10745/g.32888  ORF Transcript_10745/g.32888 Transcript_10745/m.32888 type:complete len:211 (-) Transcript_10745:293-925(-)